MIMETHEAILRRSPSPTCEFQCLGDTLEHGGHVAFRPCDECKGEEPIWEEPLRVLFSIHAEDSLADRSIFLQAPAGWI